MFWRYCPPDVVENHFGWSHPFKVEEVEDDSFQKFKEDCLCTIELLTPFKVILVNEFVPTMTVFTVANIINSLRS